MHADSAIHAFARGVMSNGPGIRRVRIVCLAVAVIVLFGLGRVIADMLVGELRIDLAAGNEIMLHRAIMTAATAHVVTLAIPFMPGAEIGVSMLMIFGGRISFLVYVSTVASLLLAYGIGRLLPVELLGRAFGLLGLRRPRDFVYRLVPMSADERMELLARKAPGRWGDFLVRHRYILLAIVLNMPGNIVIGGGGGIAIMAGMTRLFSLPLYLLTILLATAPVPLMVFITE